MPGLHAFSEEARVKNPLCTYEDGTEQDAQIKRPGFIYKDGTGLPSYMKCVQA